MGKGVSMCKEETYTETAMKKLNRSCPNHCLERERRCPTKGRIYEKQDVCLRVIR